MRDDRQLRDQTVDLAVVDDQVVVPVGDPRDAALVAAGVDAWWLMPVAVAAVLWLSLRRAATN